MYLLILFEYAHPQNRFSATGPVNPSDGTTYRKNQANSRDSFIALLLPHLFPVTRLLHHSYKKMGVAGVRLISWLPGSLPPCLLASPRPNPPCITSLFPSTWKQNCFHVKIRPCLTPLESATSLSRSLRAPIRPCLSPLFSTRSSKPHKKCPCLNPLDSITCRPLAKRPCLSPLESHSCKKYIFLDSRPSNLRVLPMRSQPTCPHIIAGTSKSLQS